MSSTKTREQAKKGEGGDRSKEYLLEEGEKRSEKDHCSQHIEGKQQRLKHYESRDRNVLTIPLHLYINVLYQDKEGKQDRKKT